MHVDQHTLNHLDCPACERARASFVSSLSATLPFSTAAVLWLDSRALNSSSGHAGHFIRPTTAATYRQYVSALVLFFGEIPLNRIHVGHLREYQRLRLAGAPPFVRYRRPQDAKARLLLDGTWSAPIGKTPCPATAKKVNQELSALKMILRRADCWTREMADGYETLEEEMGDLPRALSTEEVEHWLRVAHSNERWWVVAWYCELAFATSMGTNEMRSLRIGDVNLLHEVVSVPRAGAKNPYRARTIPILSAEAKWAAEQLLLRTADLGSTQPTHFLFPFRQRSSPHEASRGRAVSEYDPMRPMTVAGLKRIWNDVRSASGIKWFRPYDTRHTALTRWAENGMEPAMLMSLAGHVSTRMMRHYMHVSDQAKRRAMARVATIEKSALRTGVSPFYISRREKLG